VRPALVNTYDTVGGAARAALRLHQGLRAIGVESRLVVGLRQGTDPGVLGPAGAGARLALRGRRFLDSLPVRRHRARRAGVFTPAAVPDRLAARLRSLDADVVHLHWVADALLRIESLAHLGRPLVWTLHDSWAFTGGCHVPYDCTRYRAACGACPALGSARERDLSRAVWERKRRAWSGLPLTLVTPSRWLAGAARASALLGAVRCEVIPNGLDLERFRPMERSAARAQLGLPHGAPLALFGGVASASDPNKGLPLLVEALGRLSASGGAPGLELVVFGAAPEDLREIPGVRIRALGRVADERTLARLYAAADVFVAPSLQENLPNTILEAMACGTPGVAFDAGGTPDLIVHRETGYLARPYEPEDLAEGLAWVLGDPERGLELGARGRAKAEREFEISAVAGRYASLYRELLERKGT
jgi:glycosyltransferase involved in cell wall biosynthesis